MKRWGILLALYLGALLPALLLAAQPAGLLWDLANRPLINDIASGMPTWLMVDTLGLLLRGQMSGSLVPPGLIDGLRSLTWGILFLPLVGGVVSAFLYGGMLRAYREAAVPLGWRAFFGGCWRWFGCFLALGMLQAIFFSLGALILVLLALLAAARLGLWIGALALVILLSLWGIWVAFFEITRFQAIAANTRNPFRAIQCGVVFIFRHPGQVTLFYTLALLVLLGLHGLFRLVLLPLIPPAAVFPALFIQQVYIFLRLLARAARLAGLMELNDPRL
jgi:hypothetical protein